MATILNIIRTWYKYFLDNANPKTQDMLITPILNILALGFYAIDMQLD